MRGLPPLLMVDKISKNITLSASGLFEASNTRLRARNGQGDGGFIATGLGLLAAVAVASAWGSGDNLEEEEEECRDRYFRRWLLW